MKKVLLLSLISFFVASESSSQLTKYIVRLKNKGGNPFSLSNPNAYLSQRAIDRRTRYNIGLDSTDLPVTPSYVTQIDNVPNVTVINVSKWLNAVCIQTTDANAITTINGFPFVQSVTAFAARSLQLTPRDKFEQEDLTPIDFQRPGEIEADYYNYGANPYTEIHLHNGEFLHNIGLRGQNMRIAMLDAGFTNFNSLRSFDSMNAELRVLDTFDFVSRNTNVHDHSHGMQCLSIIVANIPGQFVGKAPKASFYLYRTEDATPEYPNEEFYWSCGAERADSAGAEVISTSLGYTTFDDPSLNHTYNDMNGNTTLAAIAADLAAKKGILVFAAVGNDGSGSWHFLSTPSDGDSVMAVGAVTNAGVIWPGSSYGPSSDGQIKPDVASIGSGATIQGTNNAIVSGTGTSFACPNMAGLGTCLWQGFPEFNNMKIRFALWASGSKALTPDDRVGYGIPNVKLAFAGLLIDYSTASGTISNCSVALTWNSKDVRAMKYEVERKAPGEANYSKIADVNPLPGDVLANHTYQLNNSVNGVSNGTVSYRFRQIIDTAAASFMAVYLDTVNITVAGCVTTGTGGPNADKDFVKVSPNPTPDNQVVLTVQTKNAVSEMPVRIYDMKGRLMSNLQFSKLAGKSNFDIPVNILGKGNYIIKVYDREKLIGRVKFLKL